MLNYIKRRYLVISYIYKITNNINGKIYIGKTLFSIEKRWQEHCQDYNKERNEKRPIYSAMKKYGIENFSISEVEECTAKEIDEREKYWIEYYGSFKNGYNATTGGTGQCYIDYDVVTAVYNQVQNMKETAQLCGICPESVSKILKINNIKTKSSAEIIKEKASIPVNMFSLDGEYIKTFASTADAARFLMNRNCVNCKFTTIRYHISEVAKGKRKTAYGYKWRFLHS